MRMKGKTADWSSSMIGIAKIILNGAGCKWNVPNKLLLTISTNDPFTFGFFLLEPFLSPPSVLYPTYLIFIFLYVTIQSLWRIEIVSFRQGICPVCYFDSIKLETQSQKQNRHFCSTTLHLWNCLCISLLAHSPFNSFHLLCFSTSSLFNSSFHATAIIGHVHTQTRKLFATETVAGVASIK